MGHRQSVYFVSDLHLFSRRTRESHVEAAMHEAAARASRFVLGGDIFDFRWSKHRNTQDSVQAALGWLSRLAAEHRHCQFHFLPGNHDHHRDLLNGLEEMKAPNLACHLYYLRLGSNIFLHGDAIDSPQGCSEALAASRARCDEEETRPRVMHLLYDVVVGARLHKPIPYLVYPTKRVAKRILVYLRRIGQGPEDGVRNIYFGHTHRPVSNYQYQGVSFHNGGAPIRGLPFRIVEVLEADVPASSAA